LVVGIGIKIELDRIRELCTDASLARGERNPEMKARFLAIYGQKGEGKSVSDYKSEIDDLYDELEDRGFIPYGRNADFSSHEELARISWKMAIGIRLCRWLKKGSPSFPVRRGAFGIFSARSTRTQVRRSTERIS
jgi:hypothetical protein